MFPESKVTEIYCMADDFCKEFTFMQPRLCVEYVESLWTSHSSIHIHCRHV